MTATAQHNQLYIDLCLMGYGDAAQLFEMAVAMGVAVTDAPAAGAVVSMPNLAVLPAAAAIAALMSQPGYYPASDDQEPTAALVSGSVAVVPQVPQLPGVVVAEGQCLADLAMEYQGDVLALWPLAVSQGKSMTDLLQPGSRVTIPDSSLTTLQKKLINLLAMPYNKPASQLDIDGPPLTEKAEGIDYWYLYEYIVQ